MFRAVLFCLLVIPTVFGQIPSDKKCVIPRGDNDCDVGLYSRQIKNDIFCFTCESFEEKRRKVISCDNQEDTHKDILRSTKNECIPAPTVSPTKSIAPTPQPTSNLKRFRDSCQSEELKDTCKEVAFNKKKNTVAKGQGFKICKWVDKRDSCTLIKKAVKIAKKMDRKF